MLNSLLELRGFSKLFFNLNLKRLSKSFKVLKLFEEVFAMAAKVDRDACVGCESCVGVCPVSAISMSDGKALVDESACVDCGSCVSTCPVGAISQ